MEEQMRDLNQHTAEVPPRRSFFSRIVAMSTLGLFGFATSTARAQQAHADGPDWPGVLKGRHRQVFDVYSINGGSPLGFTNNYPHTERIRHGCPGVPPQRDALR